MTSNSISTEFDVTFPAGIHADWIDWIDANNQPHQRLLVWADNPSSVCPHCHETYPATDSGSLPANASNHSNDGIEPKPDMCGGCDAPIWRRWTDLPGDVTAEQVAEAVANQHRQYTEDAEAVREQFRAQLRRDLRGALSQLEAGVDPEDVATGSESVPGVWRNGDQWEAWDHDYTSDDEADLIIVTETE